MLRLLQRVEEMVLAGDKGVCAEVIHRGPGWRLAVQWEGGDMCTADLITSALLGPAPVTMHRTSCHAAAMPQHSVLKSYSVHNKSFFTALLQRRCVRSNVVYESLMKKRIKFIYLRSYLNT